MPPRSATAFATSEGSQPSGDVGRNQLPAPASAQIGWRDAQVRFTTELERMKSWLSLEPVSIGEIVRPSRREAPTPACDQSKPFAATGTNVRLRQDRSIAGNVGLRAGT